MGHMIFIMHMAVMLELKLYQTKRKKKLAVSCFVFLYLSDSWICLSNNGWNVIKMAKKFCASDGLDEDWKTKAIPLDQKLDVINSGFAQGYLAL